MVAALAIGSIAGCGSGSGAAPCTGATCDSSDAGGSDADTAFACGLCGDHETCRDQVCVPVTTFAPCSTCSDTQTCINEVCTETCSTCADDQTCVNNRECVATCDTCSSDQVCISDQCIDIGADCQEAALDCELDEYCDDTLGACLPTGEQYCEYYPDSVEISPEEQWVWNSSSFASSYVHVMMTPVVGDIDGDEMPDVAFVTYAAATSYGATGYLRVVRGDTGAELEGFTPPQVCGTAGVALGDLDGDGDVEIISSLNCQLGLVVAFNSDGTLKWSGHAANGAAHYSGNYFGAPAIADLEGDGLAEVIIGGTVYEHDGTVRFHNGDAGSGYPGSSLSTAYDMNDDGKLEIIGGNRVWNADGSELWSNPNVPDGYVAVGDFFGDDQPDVVNISAGYLRILDGKDGQVIWGPVLQPGGGRGGPPTIADFDGDGLPEIAIAGAGAYAVYDPDGEEAVLWSKPTQDHSSNITGSSVFDFDGDGAAEVVYNDECYMRVYSGKTGDVIYEVPQNSHTLVEYPLIVDADADGNAEIILAGNAAVNRCGAGFPGLKAGVRMWRDTTDNWVGTRRVWNQHAYYSTNIREDLSVPTSVTPNWRRFNTFRTNPQSFAAPNLVGGATDATSAECTEQAPAVLSFTVKNDGAVAVEAGMPVAFYFGPRTAPQRLLGVVATQTRIVPRGSETVSIEFVVTETERGQELQWFAHADDDGQGSGDHNECIEDDNISASTVTCNGPVL